MTGFARQSSESSLGTLTWELRAVNHRYLDISFKMPDELKAHEPKLRQVVGDRLKRGKVECAFHFRRAIDKSSDMELDEELIKLISARINDVSSVVRNPGRADPLDILRWPGVVQQPKVDVEPLLEEALALLESAVGAMAEMRASEGDRIGAMLEARCAEIESLATGVRDRMPEVRDAMRQRQRERLDKLDVSADPERLEVEIALLLQKIDVDEEIDRLDSHLAEIRDAMSRDDAVGRRLDFLMQELNREANTLASKSADSETTKAAVELKVLIEQMREQVQNVE
ncbi:MAG: YicC/YloC family endoribonuclease [Woeseiaceae bacterium]|nr:YicC/YloC family endoribonuclease [Woeseiaceae bacterium]